MSSSYLEKDRVKKCGKLVSLCRWIEKFLFEKYRSCEIDLNIIIKPELNSVYFEIWINFKDLGCGSLVLNKKSTV